MLIEYRLNVKSKIKSVKYEQTIYARPQRRGRNSRRQRSRRDERQREQIPPKRRVRPRHPRIRQGSRHRPSHRGNAHAGKGHLDRAVADYYEAIRINPEFVGDTDSVIEDVGKAMLYDRRNDPAYRLTFADANRSRGADFLKDGKYDRAIRYFNIALKHDPQKRRGVQRQGSRLRPQKQSYKGDERLQQRAQTQPPSTPPLSSQVREGTPLPPVIPPTPSTR